MVVAGMFAGVLVTGLAFAPLREFYESTSRGALTLPKLLDVPYGVVVCGIVFVALAGFVVAERVLRRAETPPLHKHLAVVAVVAGLLAAAPASRSIDVATLASQVAQEEDHVTALELAAWIRDRKAGLRILDLRTRKEFEAQRIPGAELTAFESIATMPFRGPGETLVLISDGGAHAAQAWVFLRALGHRDVYFLRGGMGEWNDEVLNAAQSTPVTRYFRRGGC
jgi:rhodanese-related sulfurtransferase